jgi:imidazole glycerol-phosphate synthase subunit HisH
MIALVDYGAGNLTSVQKGLAAAGGGVIVARSPDDLANATGVVVPGVGHFAATASLDDTWRAAILEGIGRGRPLLGICLGMQWLFEGSTEAPGCPGLGVLEGRCARLEDRAGTLKIPHVGWNALSLLRPSALFEGVSTASYVYFTHSFAAPVTDAACAVSAHGDTFAAAVERGHVGGVQFHPEKSGDAGLRILRNFVALCRRHGADGLD